MSGQTLTWNVGTLADQAEGTIDLVLRADPTLANNTTVTNQSQISTTTSDRTSGNNTSSAQTLVVTRSDVSVTDTGPARVSAGDAVSFTITYTNNGPSVARAVVIEDTLPSAGFRQRESRAGQQYGGRVDLEHWRFEPWRIGQHHCADAKPV